VSAPASVVVLISGSGSNLQAIIDAIHRGEINAELKAVISNRRDAFGLQRARQAAIPSEVINHAEFRDRSAFDHELIRRISAYAPNLIALAGFMRILTPVFIDRFAGYVLNIHPSLLPKFRGLHTHERALKSEEKEHGCSVHFATNELDGGPIILQARVPVLAGDTPKTLAARVLEKEHIIYPLCIRWYCEGRLVMSDGQVILEGKPLLKPLLLDELQIDSRV
jgi:phosphoribosylglycinamide formyltransferase-1